MFEDIGFTNIRTTHKPQPTTITPLPRWFMERTLDGDSTYRRWLCRTYGTQQAHRICHDYHVGGCEDHVIFWQVDIKGRVRTGKIMAYDEATGRRCKGEGAVIDWVHTSMRREGLLPEGWELTQCLYGEHLLSERPSSRVAVVEAYKTAHVGAILMPWMVWVAVDSMSGLTAERLRPLKGRDVVLFPDEGKGYQVWSEKIAAIAAEVGFSYRISSFMEGRESGADIADLE